MSIIEQIDNSPVFKLLESIIFEGPKYVAGGLMKAAGAIGEAFSGGSGNSLGEGSGFSLGSIFSRGGSDGPSAEPSRVHEAGHSIQGPAQQQSVHEVSMADLGNFSPPSVGTASMSQGAGMNV